MRQLPDSACFSLLHMLLAEGVCCASRLLLAALCLVRCGCSRPCLPTGACSSNRSSADQFGGQLWGHAGALNGTPCLLSSAHVLDGALHQQACDFWVHYCAVQ